MTQPTENRTPQGSSSVQAGDLAKQLKAIRENTGFDLDKAAEHMHLSRQILVTLENEDFAHLPEPPYVRGYLRSYARLGELDAAPLIRNYEILRGADPDAMEKHFSPLNTQRTAPRISPEMARLGVIALLVLLLILISMIPGVRNWAQTTWNEFAYKTQQANLQRQAGLTGAANPGMDSPTASTAGAVTRPTTPAAQAIAADQPVANTQDLPSTTTSTVTQSSSTSTATSTVAPAVNTPATTTNTVTTDVNAPATLANGLPNPAVPIATAAQATAPQPQSHDAPTTNIVTPPPPPATDPNPSTPETTTPAATTDSSTAEAAQGNPLGTEVAIRIEFEQEVWMQIKDAKGKRIFEALGAPNTVKELSAKTPMLFRIGNATGMKLLLNGQPYDLTPYTRGSVATFKVE
ncbi:helix-turn-helix domain-containing protein [Thiofilum flexile]|uniref:helix-turn-helix domain-containing protein n=1 Tax=Thiofilum flexile TaxID=125627 RepID=UPI0003A44BB7|nr:RodZ domain-containing protein [Thiofilum flexile]